MKNNNDRKLNILMCTVAFLLCATLFSIHFTSNLYARYITTDIDDNNARVAKFEITYKGTVFENNITADIKPDENENVTLIIENKSEVAVEYTLEVTNVTKNLPLKFKLEPKGSAPEFDLKNEPSEDIKTTKARQIAGNHTDEYILKIIWDKNNANNIDFVGMVDHLTVSVTVTQID